MNITKEFLKNITAIMLAILAGAILAFIGSVDSVKFKGIPVFAFCVAAAFVMQWIAFIPANILKTEKFYDLTGSLTYMVLIIFAVFSSSAFDITSRILNAMVLLWSSRLGLYLFKRIMKSGSDKRFREIKKSSSRFLLVWTIQAVWICYTVAAALAAVTAVEKSDFGAAGVAGALLWLSGFVFEAAADYQKKEFRRKPENRNMFISCGLWSRSRHPNYFGEILMWTGVAITALPNLSGVRLMVLVSPVFVGFLLLKVSGVPLLEKAADEKWGCRDDYQEYKRKTPVLVPKIF